MPDSSSRFAGQLAQISQGDGVIVFAGGLSAKSTLTQLTLSDGTRPPSAPSVDGMAEATASKGTLYVVDRAHDTIQSIRQRTTDPSGTVYVAEDNGSNNPLIGTLNLTSGAITPFTSSPLAPGANPKGMLYVPSAS